MKRRSFIRTSSAAVAALPFIKSISMDKDEEDVRNYLDKILYTREEVDGWFDGKLFPFSKYHSSLGWLLNNASFQDGVNKSWSVYTYAQPDGERIMSNYAGKRCRINTYGDSFTQCHQVSDNETWQEVLAANLQEPVRNFGIGGWSFYQAYLRMLTEEKRTPAPYIIFNIYEDDHFRNLDSWRNIRAKKHPQHIEATLPYIKVDIKNNQIKEMLNPCPTRDSYYDLCDRDKTFRLFRDDFVLRIMIAHEKSSEANSSSQYESLMRLTQTHGIETRVDTSKTISAAADQLFREAALFSSCRLVEKIEDFARSNNKKILYVLSYPASYISGHIAGSARWDQPFIDFMKAKSLPFVDLSEKHVSDFADYRCSAGTYLAKYFIGHYNPLGNLFSAQSVSEKLIGMLEPKPVAYR